MSSKSTRINGVAEAVMYELNKYTSDVEDAIRESAKRIATEGKTKLQLQTMPPRSETGTATPVTRREWKRYAKSWNVKDLSGRNFANFIICQSQGKKGNYRLTHLLEDGHLTRNGNTRTGKFKHIKPIEEYVIQQFQKEVDNIIEKGGK